MSTRKYMNLILKGALPVITLMTCSGGAYAADLTLKIGDTAVIAVENCRPDEYASALLEAVPAEGSKEFSARATCKPKVCKYEAVGSIFTSWYYTISRVEPDMVRLVEKKKLSETELNQLAQDLVETGECASFFSRDLGSSVPRIHPMKSHETLVSIRDGFKVLSPDVSKRGERDSRVTDSNVKPNFETAISGPSEIESNYTAASAR